MTNLEVVLYAIGGGAFIVLVFYPLGYIKLINLIIEWLFGIEIKTGNYKYKWNIIQGNYHQYTSQRVDKNDKINIDFKSIKDEIRDLSNNTNQTDRLIKKNLLKKNLEETIFFLRRQYTYGVFPKMLMNHKIKKLNKMLLLLE